MHDVALCYIKWISFGNVMMRSYSIRRVTEKYLLHLKVMQSYSPVLFELLSSSATEAYLPELRNLLKDVLAVCLNPFQKPAEAANPLHVHSSTDDGMAYYPFLPLVRSREIYVANKTSQQTNARRTACITFVFSQEYLLCSAHMACPII